MNGGLIEIFHRFQDIFSERRMDVNETSDLRSRGSNLHRQRRFMDEIRRMGSEDMHPKDPIGFGVGNHFADPRGIASC